MAARLVDPSHSSVAGVSPNVLIISGFPWYTSELAVHRYLIDLYPASAPITTRLYTNPTNGASRGHCFVEYQVPPPPASSATASGVMGHSGAGMNASHTMSSSSNGDATGTSSSTANNGKSDAYSDDTDALLPPLLRDVKRRVEEQPYECFYLKVHAYVLTSQRWSRAGRLPELPTDAPSSRWRGRAGVLVGYGDEGFSVRCGSELGLPNTLTMEGYERLERLRKRMRTASARRASGHLLAE